MTSRPSADKPALFFSLALATILLRTLSIFRWLSLAFAGGCAPWYTAHDSIKAGQIWSGLVEILIKVLVEKGQKGERCVN